MNEKIAKMNILKDKADRDLKTAELLLRQDDADFYSAIICFHCQQSIEKYLKAFLTKNECHAPKTHDVSYLALLCSDFDDFFKTCDLSDFRDYGVEIRYDDNIPTFDEARKAVQVTKQFVLNVKPHLSDEELTTGEITFPEEQ